MTEASSHSSQIMESRFQPRTSCRKDHSLNQLPHCLSPDPLSLFKFAFFLLRNFRVLTSFSNIYCVITGKHAVLGAGVSGPNDIDRHWNILSTWGKQVISMVCEGWVHSHRPSLGQGQGEGLTFHNTTNPSGMWRKWVSLPAFEFQIPIY